jgi:hypothetical protein
MQYAYQLCHNPVGHGEYSDGVHVVWVDIASDMANAPIVPNLVESWQESGNQNLKASW